MARPPYHLVVETPATNATTRETYIHSNVQLRNQFNFLEWQRYPEPHMIQRERDTCILRSNVGINIISSGGTAILSLFLTDADGLSSSYRY